eukprot:6451077-Prymnesium_polylepis.1
MAKRSCPTDAPNWEPLPAAALDQALAALPEGSEDAAAHLRAAVSHATAGDWRDVRSSASAAERLAWDALHMGHWKSVHAGW